MSHPEFISGSDGILKRVQNDIHLNEKEYHETKVAKSTFLHNNYTSIR